jgi:hypothetical protein
MQDNHCTLRSSLKIFNESCKVKTTVDRVPVSVLSDVLKVGIPMIISRSKVLFHFYFQKKTLLKLKL